MAAGDRSRSRRRCRRHAEARGITAGQFAIAWVLNNRLVTGAIAGPRTEEQWDDYLAALDYASPRRTRRWSTGWSPPAIPRRPATTIRPTRSRGGGRERRGSQRRTAPKSYPLPASKGNIPHYAGAAYLRAIGAIVLLICRLHRSRRVGLRLVKIGNWSGGAFTNDTTGASPDACIGALQRHHRGDGDPKSLESRLRQQQLVTKQGALSDRPHLRRPRTVQRQWPGHFHNSVASTCPTLRSDQAIQGVDDDDAFAEGNLFQSISKDRILLPALVNCVATVKRDGVAGARISSCRSGRPGARGGPPQTGSSRRRLGTVHARASARGHGVVQSS